MKAKQLALFPLDAIIPPPETEHRLACQECLSFMPGRSPFTAPLTFLPRQREELPFDEDGVDQ